MPHFFHGLVTLLPWTYQYLSMVMPLCINWCTNHLPWSCPSPSIVTPHLSMVVSLFYMPMVMSLSFHFYATLLPLSHHTPSMVMPLSFLFLAPFLTWSCHSTSIAMPLSFLFAKVLQSYYKLGCDSLIISLFSNHHPTPILVVLRSYRALANFVSIVEHS